ncbi:tetraacyldisaccharide 4'-kinase [Desulfobacula sp.]|uniref:tetraacyldisaccharide 4'-kinase n=1 Tax=Desulfobacula sp. TaxID=2593537 RepID=UPI002609D1F8|nr:tetraacyldisaccharide 4'-kinase [Desulfobacula sp.]
MFETWLNKTEKKITSISNREYTPGKFSLERVLVGISYGYGWGVRCRLWLYKSGILKQKNLPCFVISIGNIVVGGAGKTPMAIYLAGLLKEMGKRPVVISRGYKGTVKDDAVIVSDGDRIFSNTRESGDEPYMMAQRRSFPVVVGKDRFKAGIRAMEAFNPDVIVLDDGFQHLKLKRDFDLLLLDYSTPLGNSRFLPAGRLRETPQMSAQRADAIIFTRSFETDETPEQVKAVLHHYPGCPWFKTFHRPFIAQQIVPGETIKNGITSVKGVWGRKAVLFSGLAQNTSFYHTMEELGVNILDHLEFKDHYRYKESDISRINQRAIAVCADVILTTEKDWAKIDQDTKWGVDLMVIGIQIAFEQPQQFESLLRSRLKQK